MLKMTDAVVILILHKDAKDMIKYNCNTCDRINSEVMIHFTKNCPNKCPFCIDNINKGVEEREPDLDAIWMSLEKCLPYINTVTISGGEPCIYMEKLLELVNKIKENTNLKVIVITALPKVCSDKRSLFYEICDKIDSLQISAQHHIESIASTIVNSHSLYYPRYEFMYDFPFKEKTTISINIVRGFFNTKQDILDSIMHFNKMGYKDIKIAEMFDADNYYVDIPKMLGIKMKSPFAHGCKTEYDIKPLLPEFDGRLTIKRTCFLRTNKQEASLADLFKMITRYIKKKTYCFGVIHEDGTVAPYWI